MSKVHLWIRFLGVGGFEPRRAGKHCCWRTAVPTSAGDAYGCAVRMKRSVIRVDTRLWPRISLRSIRATDETRCEAPRGYCSVLSVPVAVQVPLFAVPLAKFKVT
jgi:hypothetical protein